MAIHMKKIGAVLLLMVFSLTFGCENSEKNRDRYMREMETAVSRPVRKTEAERQPAEETVTSAVESASTPTEDPAEVAERKHADLLLSAVNRMMPLFEREFSVPEFLLWLEADRFPDVLSQLSGAPDEESVRNLLWEKTGESVYVLCDRFAGLLDNPEAAKAAGVFQMYSDDEEIVLAFGGDLNLVDDSYVMPVLRANGYDLFSVLTGGLLEKMRSADILLLNNEFTYTQRGSALPGKSYTFRANPENVAILAEMGTDIAFLANNHIFDYGADGLYDTLETLDGAGIPGIGAGMNLDEASRPVYWIVGGRKIAYVGAGCIERYTVFTPGATAESPGIFRTSEANADPLLSVIREAARRSDRVIVNLHWGLESTAELEAYQHELGYLCIDAGADAVVGSHSHVLQGTEFYRGKPIVYSTGNFWFSRTQVKTCLLELVIHGSGEMSVKLLPCTTGGGITSLVDGDLAGQVWDYYESISFGVSIDDEGMITDQSG